MKRYQAILLALALAASMTLTACGGNAASDENSSSTESGVSSEISSEEESSEEISSEESSSEEVSSVEESSEDATSAESSEEVSSAESSKEESSSSSKPSSSSSKPTSSSSKPTSSSSKPTSSSSKPTSSSSKPSSSSSKPDSSSSESSSSKEESSSAVSSEVQGASCADIYNAAIAGVQLPAQMVLDEELINVCYTELDLNDLADYYGSTPMMVHATEIMVFRPADKAAANAVKAAIQTRVDDLYNVWSQYLPMQFELVENHQVVEKNGYILFVVAEEADKIVDQFVKAVK